MSKCPDCNTKLDIREGEAEEGISIVEYYQAEIEKLNEENLALDDELKETKRVLTVVELDRDALKADIEIFKAKVEAKKRKEKICPFYYGRPNGSDFCKKEDCALWDEITEICSKKTLAYYKAHAVRKQEAFE